MQLSHSSKAHSFAQCNFLFQLTVTLSKMLLKKKKRTMVRYLVMINYKSAVGLANPLLIKSINRSNLSIGIASFVIL